MAEVIDATLATAGKPCHLGDDPSKYLEKFDEWYEHTNLLADSIGVKDAKQKLRLTLLWGGKDFRRHTKEAGIATIGDETLDAAIEKIRGHFAKHVNLSMAVFKLMHTKQGTKSVTEFAREVNELATLCQFAEQPYTKERAMKDAIIFGTSDERLRQEALAKDLNYTALMKAALGYEQSRTASGTIKSATMDGEQSAMRTSENMDDIVARVLAGKYSSRKQQGSKPEGNRQAKCPNCPPHYHPHEPNRCPSRGKTCVVCKKKNHFAGSSACKTSDTVRALREAHTEESYHYEDYPLGRIDVAEIGRLHTTSHDNIVNLKINGKPAQLFVDSGCKKTLIPLHTYCTEMGPILPSPTRFRAYGTKTFIQVQGEVTVTLQSENGTEHDTSIYVVEGHKTEAILGDDDAKALGILTINPGGNRAHTPDSDGNQKQEVPVASITANIRAAGIPLQTTKDQNDPVEPDEKRRIDKILDKHQAVFSGIGLLTGEKVSFHIDHTVPPVAAPYRPIPLAYRDKLSPHLQDLREADKIEDVDPQEHCPWVSNVVITEKKQKGQIRMNIDMRQANAALHRTKRHVDTIKEIRHKLQGATRFSEMDMGHGYHQIALAEDSRSISTFQTHEGLHRFKVLFFGASPATDLFHDRIKAALDGLTGCMSIHDNILVWGTTPAEHERNLDHCLARLHERGLTLRRDKCTFGATSVSWFGTVFSKSGMSADPRKIRSIKDAGRPQNSEDVKSFLQACQFNARFMFDTDNAYAQITQPLRNLTRKNTRYVWSPECEHAYQEIISTMTSETALRPFNPELKTIHVADAGPEGIASSVFQEQKNSIWVPIDHASRALTPCEQNYSQTEKESLAQSWGMNIHRYYLLGVPFDSYTDHQPLLPIYNGNKKGNARVERHRLKVQGFQYNMRYLPGKSNPCDYQSRHPLPLTSYTERQLADMIIYDTDELCISKIVTDDLPDAVTLKMVQQATAQDKITQKLVKCISKGHITNDPDLKDYRQVFNELAYFQGVILRGDRLVIPDTEVMPGSGSLRQLVIDIAHEGHQGAVKCKQLLRAKVWFPHLDKMVETRISQCLGCQATTYTPTRDPLKPTILPDRPWQRLEMDFWGPLPNGEYILVMIDEYSRYPEVEFVSSTSAQAVVPHIDRVFATHGFPESVKTDGGPPFNGTDSHQYQMYMRWAGVKTTVVSLEDPEANGLAENFMKAISKIWHIAHIEGKNSKQEIYKFLRQYRATPHTTTGKAPAEVLFNRKFTVRLPALQIPVHDSLLRKRDQHAKATQKAYKDAKAYVKPHSIKVGDKVLLLQRPSKTKPRYDPHPFTVTEVQGTQITAVRGDSVRKRDAQKFKKVNSAPPRNYRTNRFPMDQHHDTDIPFNSEDSTAGGRTEPPFPPPAPQRANDHQYPNGHLDPNVDINLARQSRNRQPPKQYDPQTGTWT